MFSAYAIPLVCDKQPVSRRGRKEEEEENRAENSQPMTN
jgi:hypothetical protein